MEIVLKEIQNGIGLEQLKEAVMQSLQDKPKLKKVLLLPPDITRMNSGAGFLTALYYSLLPDDCEVRIMPALGTHLPMTRKEQESFFGKEIPEECFLVHNWKEGVVKLGEVPKEYVSEASEGLVNEPIDVELSDVIVNGEWDLIISLGQVVPHEVAGMASYTKNLLVGCGGSSMINKSHMVGAFYGAERVMGKDHSPVRKIFDYAQEHFLQRFPIMHVLTVTTQIQGKTKINGLFIGDNRIVYEKAVSLSQELNIIHLDRRINTCITWLDPKEFHSTWVGNKAIYRTRMALAPGAKLIILAPEVDKFGEDPNNDKLIRKYGYCGRKKVLELCEQEEELKKNLSVAAHLIHGSSDEQFSIIYAAPNLTDEEIRSVNFIPGDLETLIAKYNPGKLTEGWNVLDDAEEVYFIKNPALGLWTTD